MVPTFTCGLSRSNFSLATAVRSCLEVCRGFPGEPVKAIESGRDRLAGPVLDDLLGDVRRDLVVALELHGGRGPALRVGAQVRDVPEHLAERDVRGDREGVAPALLALE